MYLLVLIEMIIIIGILQLVTTHFLQTEVEAEALVLGSQAK